MLTRLALALLATWSCNADARADRFYFGCAETEQRMTTGCDSIEGVLVKNEAGVMEIRVVGGTITVPESMVYKVDRDLLTVKAIEAREERKARQRTAALRATRTSPRARARR